MSPPSSERSEDTDVNFEVQYMSPEDSTSSNDNSNYVDLPPTTELQPRMTLLPIQEEMTPPLPTKTFPSYTPQLLMTIRLETEPPTATLPSPMQQSEHSYSPTLALQVPCPPCPEIPSPEPTLSQTLIPLHTISSSKPDSPRSPLP
uniref:Uncharacterized protein n=1 Tax=Moniliophthora roreri TaxID=221103 RepID=A0A0W0G8Z8_MONRR